MRLIDDDRRVDKSVISVVPLEKEDDDLEYWLSKTPDERFRAIEQIRATIYGYAGTSLRLQRVLTIAEL